MHDQIALVAVQQMLPPRLCRLQYEAVYQRGTRGETPLRAAHFDSGSAVPALMQPREPVQSVALGHRQAGLSAAGAPGTAGASPVRSYSDRMSMRR